MRVGEMTGRMRWAGSIALVAAAPVTAACTLPPPSPTGGPGEPAPTPVAVEELAARVDACEAAPEAQEPDYDAEAAVLEVRGTVVEVSVDVESAADDHGSHGLGPTEVLVVRGEEVVGVVVGETWQEEPDGAAIAATPAAVTATGVGRMRGARQWVSTASTSVRSPDHCVWKVPSRSMRR